MREEEDFPEGTNYTSGAIHALEMLNQVVVLNKCKTLF